MSNDDFSDPTSGGDRIEGGIGALEGRLCLFTPVEYIGLNEDGTGGIKTADYGNKDAVSSDVVILAETKGQKTETYSGVLFFQGHLIGALKKKAGTGSRVLGVVVRGKEKVRGNYPWLLNVATDAQKKIARDYLASVPKDADEDPFAV